MDLHKLESNFKKNTFKNEDDIKIHFHSDIIEPILKEFNPQMVGHYHSEHVLKYGGRTDATFQNISFEFKKEAYFDKQSGIDEAVRGRNELDHGLYDYLISNAEIDDKDDIDLKIKKILSGIGVGFDGKQFVFARFIPSTQKKSLDTNKVKVKIQEPVNLDFTYEVKPFYMGIKKLVLLLKQTNKISLSKQTLCDRINPKSEYVRNSILTIYKNLDANLDTSRHDTSNNRVQTLYQEWDRVFGIMYGNDQEATDYTEVSSKIRELYGIDETVDIDSKMYLFSMQTFFNIFLKLLVYSFLSSLVDPLFSTERDLSKYQINGLFDGNLEGSSKLVNNFFESHFLEWFTFTADVNNIESSFDVHLVNETITVVNEFDLSTFVLKPENVQDILQEVYMGLIPQKMRHLMGEYFSPDWIVEHALDMVGYDGDLEKKIIDPTCGDGPFLTQAIKRIVKKKQGKLTKEDITKITKNVVGFDINPISVVAAKANYILIMFSAFFDNCDEKFDSPIGIPVFIADSILAPIVYTEENENTLKLDTTVGKIEIPKFESFSKSNEFLRLLSKFIDDRGTYDVFINLALGKKLIKDADVKVVESLFEKLSILHRASKDSFWPIIFRNTFAPVIIRDKFDFVVGNPPWIAWKAMSKSYRDGTLTIWQSYGIFEKNAYDKKTTHDDFGMAVTYVSVDQFLKNEGKMIFLLPATFLKSSKGGEGFRKFEIIRNNQKIPFSVEEVHDFSGVKLFTVPSVAIKFIKGKPMTYPMSKYRFYTQIDGKRTIDSHANWEQASRQFTYENCLAQPVDKDNPQSAWLTLKDMTFANNVLNTKISRVYKGRKGIEPAGAKGVYILLKPQKIKKGYLEITNDISRQRRQDIIDKGVHTGIVEDKYIYPMLGGRNIVRWYVKTNEFMIVPHSEEFKYGIPEETLAREAPDTYLWLRFYHDELLNTRIKNGKFFNQKIHPFYRLDNIGTYTYSPYKVLWKEQTSSMSAVVVSTYLNSVPDADENLFSEDKPIVIDSKVLMLDLYNELEAYYVCGIINSPCVIKVIDGYAISTNRGVDVLKNVAIPKYNSGNSIHRKIATISKRIHDVMKESRGKANIESLESSLDKETHKLFS